MRDGWDFAARHERAQDGTQCDLPRMIEGGVDALVFAVYTTQAARTESGLARAHATALKVFARTHEVIAKNAAKCGVALTADEALRFKVEGKCAFFLSIENAYSLGRDAGNVQKFYDLGVRMLGFTHMLNNDVADSSTDPRGAEWGGLSPLGREMVAEANRLGIVLDGSHASDAATLEMISLSRAPMVLSHTGCKGVCDHLRNVDDDLLRALAAKGGVIQINALPIALVNAPNNGQTAAIAEVLLQLKDAELTPEKRAEMSVLWKKIDAQYPNPQVTLADYIAHVEHAVSVVGIDHVGIGCDLDGGGGIPNEMDDVSQYPNLTAALVARGWSAESLAKLWGGNTLRVFRECARLAH